MMCAYAVHMFRAAAKLKAGLVVAGVEIVVAATDCRVLPMAFCGKAQAAQRRRVDVLKYPVLVSVYKIAHLVPVGGQAQIVGLRGVLQTRFNIARLLGLEVWIGAPGAVQV